MFAHLLFTVIFITVKIASAEKSVNFFKCCDNDYTLNDSFKCTKKNGNITSDGSSFEITKITNETGILFAACAKSTLDHCCLIIDSHMILHNNNIMIIIIIYFNNVIDLIDCSFITDGTGEYLRNVTCADMLANGTRVTLTCDWQLLPVNDTSQECDSVFTMLHFWGATMVIFATIVYNVPLILVVVIYCALPTLRTRAYDKAVLCYNTSYMIINFLLIILGFYSLCHAPMSAMTYRFFGLSLMFFTEASVVWLFIIAFDMTLVITRFRWAPKGGASRGREEKRKFLIYAAWGWGVPAFLTFIAVIAEFSPIFPEGSLLRPNFHDFHHTNVSVIVYVVSGPVVICMINTCLFVYTTAKTIAVQRSTAIVNENRKNNVKKKYLMFLKLYLLMDTPWFTSALGAIFPNFWILKFIKMIQPVLLLILLIPRKRVLAAMKCQDRGDNEAEAVHLQHGSRKNAIKKPNCTEKC